jgi:hypothetical protein
VKWRSTEPSREGKFHECDKVPNGQEIPMARSIWASARLIRRFGKRSVSPTTPGAEITRADAEIVTATAKRRRREAQLDKRFKPKMSEKQPLGGKNTFLGNGPKKKIASYAKAYLPAA